MQDYTVSVGLTTSQIYKCLCYVQKEKLEIEKLIKENCDLVYKSSGNYLITFLNNERTTLRQQLSELESLADILTDKL